MFEKEFREWFEINKKWLYSSDHLQAAYFAWCAGIKQQQAAQQSVQADALESCDNNHHYIKGDDPAICSCGKPVRR